MLGVPNLQPTASFCDPDGNFSQALDFLFNVNFFISLEHRQRKFHGDILIENLSQNYSLPRPLDYENNFQ